MKSNLLILAKQPNSQTAKSFTFAYQRLDNLQVLRGIAAVMVLLLHGTYGILPGNFGVDIFFCISGFIMVYVTQQSTKDFFAKRLIRVVPLYWYATLQRFVLLWVCYKFGIENPDRRDLSSFASSLFFLPNNGAPMQSLGWSLYYEMAFYALFALACFISKKNRAIIAFAEMAVVVLVALFFKADYSMLLELAGGMAAFNLLKRLYELPTSWNWRLIFGAASVVAFAALVLTEKFELLEGVPRFIRYGALSFIFVVTFVKATQNLKLPKPFVLCGDISFSLYLMQLDVLAVLKGALIFLGLVPSIDTFTGDGFVVEKMITTIIGGTLTFGVSLITYNLIEKKLTNFLREKLLRPKKPFTK